MTNHDAYRKGAYLLHKKIKEVTGKDVDIQTIIDDMTADGCYTNPGRRVCLFFIWIGDEHFSYCADAERLNRMKVPAKYMALKKTKHRNFEGTATVKYEWLDDEGKHRVGRLSYGGIDGKIPSKEALARTCGVANYSWYKVTVYTNAQAVVNYLKRKFN